MQFDVNVYLCLVSKEPNKFLVGLSANDQTYTLPSSPLISDKTPKMIASHLLSDLTGLSSVWAVLLSYGASETIINYEKEGLPILFYCAIPEPVRLTSKYVEDVSGKKYSWEDYNVIKDRMDDLTLGLIHESIYKRI